MRPRIQIAAQQFRLQPNFGKPILCGEAEPGTASEVTHRIGDVGEPNKISRRPRLGQCLDRVVDRHDFFHRGS